MHNDGQLAGNGDRGALEADPFPELETPFSQTAVGLAAGEDSHRRLVK